MATVQSGAVTAEYLYGMNGTLTTELAPDGTLLRGLLYGGGMHLADYTQNGKTVFHLSDEVGSLVNTIDQTGAAIESCAANPFGESLNCSPSVDYTENHFTDKKRDQESGLDYFGARYYGSTFGRFMSPDSVGGSPENPQSWNLYSYVQNNPLTNTDPDGHDCIVQSSTSSTTESISISSGNCGSVSIGDGQSKTYVPGMVTSITANGGNSIDIGYNSYDGQSSGVTNAGAAPQPDFPGLAYNYGNNAQGYQMLGAANKLVTNTTIAVAGVYGGLAAATAGPEAAAAVGRWGLQRLAMGASSPALLNLINRLYQAQDKISGGTAGAVRNEMATGEYVNGGHAIKASEMITALTNLINSGELSGSDQTIAGHIISDLKNSLGR